MSLSQTEVNDRFVAARDAFARSDGPERQEARVRMINAAIQAVQVARGMRFGAGGTADCSPEKVAALEARVANFAEEKVVLEREAKRLADAKKESESAADRVIATRDAKVRELEAKLAEMQTRVKDEEQRLQQVAATVAVAPPPDELAGFLRANRENPDAQKGLKAVARDRLSVIPNKMPVYDFAGNAYTVEVVPGGMFSRETRSVKPTAGAPIAIVKETDYLTANEVSRVREGLTQLAIALTAWRTNQNGVAPSIYDILGVQPLAEDTEFARPAKRSEPPGAENLVGTVFADEGDDTDASTFKSPVASDVEDAEEDAAFKKDRITSLFTAEQRATQKKLWQAALESQEGMAGFFQDLNNAILGPLYKRSPDLDEDRYLQDVAREIGLLETYAESLPTNSLRENFVQHVAFLMTKLATGIEHPNGLPDAAPEIGENSDPTKQNHPNFGTIYPEQEGKPTYLQRVKFDKKDAAKIAKVRNAKALVMPSSNLPAMNAAIAEKFERVIKKVMDKFEPARLTGDEALMLPRWFPETVKLDGSINAALIASAVTQTVEGKLSPNFVRNDPNKQALPYNVARELKALYSGVPRPTGDTVLWFTRQLFFSRTKSIKSRDDEKNEAILAIIGTRPVEVRDKKQNLYPSLASASEFVRAAHEGHLENLEIAGTAEEAGAALTAAAAAGQAEAILHIHDRFGRAIEPLDWAAAHSAALAEGHTNVALLVSAALNDLKKQTHGTSEILVPPKNDATKHGRVQEAVTAGNAEEVARAVARAIVDRDDNDLAAGLLIAAKSGNLAAVPIFAGARDLLLEDDWKEAQAVASSDEMRNLIEQTGLPYLWTTDKPREAFEKKYKPRGASAESFKARLLKDSTFLAKTDPKEKGEFTVLVPTTVEVPDAELTAFVLYGSLGKDKLVAKRQNLAGGQTFIGLRENPATHNMENVIEYDNKTWKLGKLEKPVLSLRRLSVYEISVSSSPLVMETTAPVPTGLSAFTKAIAEANSNLWTAHTDEEAHAVIDRLHAQVAPDVPAVDSAEWSAAMSTLREALASGNFDQPGGLAWERLAALDNAKL